MKRSTWTDYQKDIADNDYYYARSCIRQNFFPGSEKAFLNIVGNDLGRNIYDDPLHTSCTGIGYHADIVPLETIMAVVARQFALMTEAGYENFTSSCITSFGIYTELLSTWEEFPETEERTRENLYKATGREFSKPKNLAHTSDVIFHHRKEIATKAKRRLINAFTGEPLRVVEHIGCHYARSSPRRVSVVRSSPMFWQVWSRSGAARLSTTPSVVTAVALASATTSFKPTEATLSPTLTRS